MSDAQFSDRAEKVLAAVSLRPATTAASGRYLRTPPFRSGLRYWSTSRQRHADDAFGIQFYGEGMREAALYEPRLVRAGFIKHKPQPNQLTYARRIPYGPGESLDVEAIKAARADLDAILNGAEPGPTVGAGPASAAPTPSGAGGGFRDFMLASPLADADLPPVDRNADWRPQP